MGTKTKLNYRFHNENSVEQTADYIAKIFLEVNMKKMERVLREASEKQELKRQEDRDDICSC